MMRVGRLLSHNMLAEALWSTLLQQKTVKNVFLFNILACLTFK